MPTKVFELGEILSVTTGCLLSRKLMGGLYDIMGFLIQDQGITTLGLLDMAEPCKAELIRQFPQFADIEVPEFEDDQAVWTYLQEQENKFGTYFEVKSMESVPPLRNDLDVILDIRGNLDGVVVVNPDRPESMQEATEIIQKHLDKQNGE
jgi:hypothetical protein